MKIDTDVKMNKVSSNISLNCVWLDKRFVIESDHLGNLSMKRLEDHVVHLNGELTFHSH